MMIGAVVCVWWFLSIGSEGWLAAGRGYVRAPTKSSLSMTSERIVSLQQEQSKTIRTIMKTACTVSATALLVSSARADQGSIKSSTLEESKAAALQVKACLDGLKQMDVLADKKDFQAIGDMLSTPSFQKFESAATVLVRSDAISADDKVALGTIKRYGVVADYIIMSGGLMAELRSGGIKVAGAGGPANGAPIDDDDDENDSEKTKTVNEKEVKRYIKLSIDSLSDVAKIVLPILSK